MKVPYSWLKEYVDVDYYPEELAEKLTLQGLEVEAMEKLDPGLNDVIVGEIKSIENHPEADKLKVCRVFDGEQVLSTISGAPNLKTGAKVAYAPLGTVLPDGTKIREVELRGVVSKGMICSIDELGLQKERADGILILDENTVPGRSLVPVLGLDDTVFVFDLTPNYAHALSIIGVAREVSALSGVSLKTPSVDIDEKGKDINSLVSSVEIKAQEFCQRYSGRLITGVTVQPSPLWMQQRLRAVGIRPINNIVDITNYILILFGQPLHAFDFDKISGGRIEVRRAGEGESLVTLDGEKRRLNTDMLVIADSKNPIGLAGVMGGLETEVTESTERIFLESANFNMVNIRRTAKALGISSEASHRFERGVDITGTVRALDASCELMRNHAGGIISEGLVDIYTQPLKPRKISICSESVNDLLGSDLDLDDISRILFGFEFNLSPGKTDKELIVTIPAFRNDIEQEADIIEEIARGFGYDKIKVTLPDTISVSGEVSDDEQYRRKLRDILTGAGLNEIISYSFINPDNFDRLNLESDDSRRNAMVLKNPLSSEMEIMRTSLIPCLLEAAAFNVRRDIDELAFFELSRVFLPAEKEGSAKKNKKSLNRPDEELRIGALINSNKEEGCFGTADAFYRLKGIVEEIGNRLHLSGKLTFSAEERKPFHPQRTAVIYIDGEEVGVLGELHPEVQKEYQLKDRAALFELKYAPFYNKGQLLANYSSLPRFPAVKRDIAALVPTKHSSKEIVNIMKEAGGEILEKVDFFDLYEGEQIPEDHRSLAYSLIYRAHDRTLTDDEVDKVQEKIITRLNKELNARVRDA